MSPIRILLQISDEGERQELGRSLQSFLESELKSPVEIAAYGNASETLLVAMDQVVDLVIIDDKNSMGEIGWETLASEIKDLDKAITVILGRSEGFEAALGVEGVITKNVVETWKSILNYLRKPDMSSKVFCA